MLVVVVIPAPIVYIKVVVVKKLVVDFLSVNHDGFGFVVGSYRTENFSRPLLVEDVNRSFY